MAVKVLAAASLLLSLLALPASAARDFDFRGQSNGDDSLDLVGTVLDWTERAIPVEGPAQRRGSAAPAGGAERYCPPTLYTHGIYREIITECDGAGGTELVPFFEPVDGQEADPAEAPQRQVFVVTREDVQSLLVNPGSLVIQPDQFWVLVNTDTIVMTDAAEHVLNTQVLGYDVDVRVTPALFTWDFGDGSPPVTGTDPGAPWPNHTVSHAYSEAGTVSISLRAEWDAAFRVEGTPAWIPVEGRAVTTVTSEPLEVVTATPRLTTG